MMRPMIALALAPLFVAFASACGHAPDDSRIEGEAAAPAKLAAQKPAVKAAPAQGKAAQPVKAALAQPKEEAAPAACDEPPSGECNCHDQPKEEAAPAVEQVNLGDAPVRGAARAPVTIVLFSDFECPFCKKVEATLQQVEEKYHGRVRIAFRSQPLPFHEHARLASRAALAAHEQGKFWEYHDALFTHQRALERADLERYAAELHLDMSRFRAALDDDRTARAVDADVAEATRLGVAGTPTTFINGRRVIGAQPIAKFEAMVEEALGAQR